ncbi:MAG: ribonuclease III [Hormoscilla sp. SP12CHS1]|nr:ribonuclease III [Hormoscilla sp. SP12CHS1]
MKLPEIANRNLRKRALTHESFANENNCPDNERLEFLGDAVLGFIVSDLLYRTPNMNEGDMTRLRSKLVDESKLAAFARQFHLGDRLYLGHGEKQSGGRDKDKILGDAFEAYIGALYLDSGLDRVRSFIEPLIQEIINDGDGIAMQVVDEKSQFQQWTLAYFGTTPTYRIVNESGPDHARIFTALACVKGKVYGMGTGKKKQDAEKAAARNAYQKLSGNP